MSLKAMAWAIDQTCGTPSAKVTLWAIANHAGPETWLTWAAQSYYTDETEQSADSVQRRLPELEARCLVRRMPLRYDGRKSTDLLILKPSPYWDASIEEIEKLLPRGLSVDPKFAAAYVAADRGCDEKATQPQTLPQPAENVAATVRSQEPDNKPGNLERDARARADEAEPGPEAPHMPNAIWLDVLRSQAPTTPYDSRDEVDAEWRKLTVSDRKEAFERYAEWLDGAKRIGRQKLAGLATYLREKRWQPLGAKAAAIADSTPKAGAFDRAWWWLFWDFVTRFSGQLGDRDSWASRHLRQRVSEAQSFGGGWSLGSYDGAPTDLADLEERALALKQTPKDGDAADLLTDHCWAIADFKMPKPDAVQWIFAPPDLIDQLDRAREPQHAHQEAKA